MLCFGAMNRIEKYAKEFVLENYPDVDNKTAMQMYDAFIAGCRLDEELKETDYEKIIKTVCRYYGTTLERVKDTRKHEVVFVRQVCMYFGKLFDVGTLSYIGMPFNRDHATVLHSYTVILDYIDTERRKAYDISVLYERIKKILR